MEYKFLLIFIIIFLYKKNFQLKIVPYISVIVPIYNSEKYLLFCLESIMAQSLKNIEIICIDDGSKDESINIIKNFIKIDNRIILISQNNQGAGIARNIGIALTNL